MQQIGTTPDGHLILVAKPEHMALIEHVRHTIEDAHLKLTCITHSLRHPTATPPAEPDAMPEQPPTAQPAATKPAKFKAAKPDRSQQAKPKATTIRATPRKAPEGKIPWSHLIHQVLVAAGKPLSIGEIYEAIKDAPELAGVPNAKHKLGVNIATSGSFVRVSKGVYDIKNAKAASDAIMTVPRAAAAWRRTIHPASLCFRTPKLSLRHEGSERCQPCWNRVPTRLQRSEREK